MLASYQGRLYWFCRIHLPATPQPIWFCKEHPMQNLKNYPLFQNQKKKRKKNIYYLFCFQIHSALLNFLLWLLWHTPIYTQYLSVNISVTSLLNKLANFGSIKSITLRHCAMLWAHILIWFFRICIPTYRNTWNFAPFLRRPT